MLVQLSPNSDNVAVYIDSIFQNIMTKEHLHTGRGGRETKPYIFGMGKELAKFGQSSSLQNRARC